MIMETNYALVKKILREVNETYCLEPHEGFVLLMNDVDDTIYIGFGDECISKTNFDFLEEVENPFEMFISDFYTYNSRAQSKESARAYEYYLKKKFKEMMKCNDEAEILKIVAECKHINMMKIDLKDDLEFTKNVAKMLYYGKELFNIALEEEYEI